MHLGKVWTSHYWVIVTTFSYDDSQHSVVFLDSRQVSERNVELTVVFAPLTKAKTQYS